MSSKCFLEKHVSESEANYGAVSLVDTNWTSVGRVEKVPQVVLDEMFFVEGATCPSMIKIDVEGMELNVLRGASKVCSEKNHINIIANYFSSKWQRLSNIVNQFFM